MFNTVRKKRAKIVKQLLAQPQIRFDPINEQGYTALSLAAYFGYDGIVVLLLLAGAGTTVNMVSHDGQGALILAASANHLRIVDILLYSRKC
ncbi:MAG: ankyrin repeat domain-containing protein [Oligoflexales bacterium]|nr:ankyrin repeat domain-containing protein [Oligoflexales bacterium]